MDLLFENLLYQESLKSPKNILASMKNVYPGLKDGQLQSDLAAMGIKIKQSRLEKEDGTLVAVIRYNARQGTAFGGIGAKDEDVRVIAITNSQDQQGKDIYTVYTGTVADLPKQDSGSWSLSKNPEDQADAKWKTKKKDCSLAEANACIVSAVRRKLEGMEL